MRLLKLGIAALIIGGLVTGISVAAATFVGYLLGLGVAGLGLALLIMVGLRRRMGSGALRWVIALTVPMILVAAAVIIPQVRIGRPDSKPLWQASVGGPLTASGVVGARLFTHGDYSDQVIDTHSGRTLVSVPALEYKIFVGTDGSFVQYGKTTLTYRDADGKERWSIKPSGINVSVLAIGDGSVVLNRCPGVAKACAIGSDGSITWSSPAGGWIGSMPWERQVAGVEETADSSGFVRVPTVLARNTDSGVEISDASGNKINTAPGRGLAVGGDRVIVQNGCQVSGYRAGRRTFRTSNLPCGAVGYSARLLLSNRLYLASGDDLDRGYAVDLSDGSFRGVGRVETQLDSDGPIDTGIPGDDIIVRRTGHRLDGIDPATGRQLWTYTTDGQRAPGISVEAGAVIVLGDLDDRTASLAGLDPDESPSRVAVLDARSGKVTGRRVNTGGDLSSAQGLSDSRGLGPGRALLIINSGDAYAIGA